MLMAARNAGRTIARSGRPLFSGGAHGCDQVFAESALQEGGGIKEFNPTPSDNKAAFIRSCFARSEAALSEALAHEGGAIIILHPWAFNALAARSSCRGGTAWSARCARRIGIPLITYTHTDTGWESHVYSPERD